MERTTEGEVVWGEGQESNFGHVWLCCACYPARTSRRHSVCLASSVAGSPLPGWRRVQSQSPPRWLASSLGTVASCLFQKSGNGPGPHSIPTPNIAVAASPSCCNQALVLQPWEPWTVHREIPAAFRPQCRFPVMGGTGSEHHIQDRLLFYSS